MIKYPFADIKKHDRICVFQSLRVKHTTSFFHSVIYGPALKFKLDEADSLQPEIF